MVGKLDGVADQVDQHLAQAQRVANQCGGHIGADVKQQFQPLVLRPDDAQIGQVFHHVFQMELCRLEAHFAGLDLGEIKNVVDDAQQIARRRVHLFDVIALLGAQVGLQRQMRHPNDGIHGGADFVAHVGQKTRLHAGRIFGQLFGLAHQFGGLALLRHIVKHPHRAQRQVVRIDGAATDAAPEAAAILAAHFLGAVVNLAAQDVLIGAIGEHHVGWIPHPRGLPHEGAQRPAKQLIQAVIGAHDLPFLDEGDAQGCGVKNGGLLVTDLANGPLHPLLLRNVAHRRDEQGAFIILGHIARHINVKQHTVAAGELGLEPHRTSSVAQFFDHRLRRALRQAQHERRRDLDAHDVLCRGFHQRQTGSVGVDHRQGGGVSPKHGFGIFDHGAVEEDFLLVPFAVGDVNHPPQNTGRALIVGGHIGHQKVPHRAVRAIHLDLHIAHRPMGLEFGNDLFPCFWPHQGLVGGVAHLHVQQIDGPGIGETDDPIGRHRHPDRCRVQNVLQTVGLVLQLLEQGVERLPCQRSVDQEKHQQLRPQAAGQVPDAHAIAHRVDGPTHGPHIVDKTQHKENAHDGERPQQRERHLVAPVPAQ